MSVVGSTPASIADRRHQHDQLELRALVERAKDDPDAFAALYRRFLSPVYGFAFKRSGSREVAEDVTSATFERVWKGMASFEWTGGGFEPWLFRIAAVELAAHYRRAAKSERPRAQLALREYAEGAPSGPELDEVDLDGLRAALATLRPRYQRAISLRYLAGLSHEEAAEAMGCSKAVMAVTLHRATAALRRAVQAAAGKEDQ